MTARGIPAPECYRPAAYWEERARRFAGEGAGLGAVCAYGMPEFYNRMIHFNQRLARTAVEKAVGLVRGRCVRNSAR